jgi:hypothetical protein
LRSREILLGEPFGLPPLQLPGMPGLPRGLGFSKAFCKGVLARKAMAAIE